MSSVYRGVVRRRLMGFRMTFSEEIMTSLTDSRDDTHTTPNFFFDIPCKFSSIDEDMIFLTLAPE